MRVNVTWKRSEFGREVWVWEPIWMWILTILRSSFISVWIIEHSSLVWIFNRKLSREVTHRHRTVPLSFHECAIVSTVWSFWNIQWHQMLNFSHNETFPLVPLNSWLMMNDIVKKNARRERERDTFCMMKQSDMRQCVFACGVMLWFCVVVQIGFHGDHVMLNFESIFQQKSSKSCSIVESEKYIYSDNRELMSIVRQRREWKIFEILACGKSFERKQLENSCRRREREKRIVCSRMGREQQQRNFQDN